jgi:serine protease Do
MPGAANTSTGECFLLKQEVLQMNMKRTNPWQRRALGSALAMLLVSGQALALPNATDTAQQVLSKSTISGQQGPASFSAIVKSVQPAVVNVATSGNTRGMPGAPEHNFKMPEFPKGSPFADMFKEFMDKNQGMQVPGNRGGKFRAAGSGFIVSTDGYVVTNNHVVEHADKIEVILHDGKRYQASIAGSDPKTDLALLKIEPEKALPFVELGNSDQASVGDWVVAVGNPFGLGGTVTAGIISARGRDIQSGPFDDFLQIDAPINLGNSGGPLFDTRGQVIGINTAIFSPGGGNVGIGFAIPANMAKSIVTQLKTTGSVERGWLGIQFQPVTEEIANSLNLEEKQGVLVSIVMSDSPAAMGGVKPGDIIIRMNDELLDEKQDLPKLVAHTKAGSTATLDVLRQGKTHTLEVKIGHMPNDDAQLAVLEKDTPADTPRLGIYLAPLTDELRKRFDISAESQGVLVADVEKNSPAEEAGIRAGTLINMIGQEKVSSPEQLISKVKEAAKNERPSVLLLVQQGSESRFITVEFTST